MRNKADKKVIVTLLSLDFLFGGTFGSSHA